MAATAAAAAPAASSSSSSSLAVTLATRDMSLLRDDDYGATLAAALAFIDECDYNSGGGLTSTDDFSEQRSTDDDSDSKDDDCGHPTTSSSNSTTSSSSSSSSSIATAAAAGARNPSLRFVIRTTSNKRFTAAAPPTATNEPSPASATARGVAALTHRLAEKPRQRTSARAATPMQRPAYPNKESVLRFRARKKAEAERLRSEVVELETELTKLRRRGVGESDEPDSGNDSAAASAGDGSRRGAATTSALAVTRKNNNNSSSNKAFWMDEAVRQARERYKSEALNQQLREAIAKQRTMGDALQTLLGNMSDTASSPSLVEPERLAEAQKEAFYYDTFASVETRTIMGLEASIAQMYKFCDAVFPPACVEVPTQSVQVLPGHPETGPATGVSYVEIRTTTPLGCTFLEGADMIWSLITTPPPKKERAYYVTKTQRTETRYQKNYTVFLDRTDGAVELKGYSLLYRYVEADRVVFMWASSITAASVDGPTIREKAWVTVTKSNPAHPHIPAALQVCHQIFSDDHARATAMSRFSFGNPSYLDRAYAEHEMREFVLSYIVNRTRAQYANIQTFLLRSLGKFITRHQIETHMPEVLHC